MEFLYDVGFMSSGMIGLSTCVRKGGRGLLIELVLLGAEGRTVLGCGGGNCQLFSCLKPGICA